MKTKINRLPKSEIELIIRIPFKEVKKAYDRALEKEGKKTEIKGFRKGKAPKKVVEESVGKKKLYEEVIGELLPKYYSQAIKEHDLKPIINPQVTPVSLKEGKDWEFKAVVCETPKVDLGDYKKKMEKEITKDKIWVPGKGKEKEDEKDKEVRKAKKINKAIDILLKEAKVELAPVLVEDEVKRRLSQVLDEVKKLGLTLDEYLKNAGKTAEELREEQREKAEETLKLEFILNKIAEDEDISVTDADLKKALDEVKSEEERKKLECNSYFLAMLLRRQKVIEFLQNL